MGRAARHAGNEVKSDTLGPSQRLRQNVDGRICPGGCVGACASPSKSLVPRQGPSVCGRDGCRSVSADCKDAPAGLQGAAEVGSSGMGEGAVAHAWDA